MNVLCCIHRSYKIGDRLEVARRADPHASLRSLNPDRLGFHHTHFADRENQGREILHSETSRLAILRPAKLGWSMQSRATCFSGGGMRLGCMLCLCLGLHEASPASPLQPASPHPWRALTLPLCSSSGRSRATSCVWAPCQSGCASGPTNTRWGNCSTPGRRPRRPCCSWHRRSAW